MVLMSAYLCTESTLKVMVVTGNDQSLHINMIFLVVNADVKSNLTPNNRKKPTEKADA